MDQQQQQQNEEEPPVLRSIHNRHSSFVRFINKTRHSVGVYWIDYQGKRVRYRILNRGDYVDINTFVTHPWIFVDEETKDRYRGNGQEVYFPELPTRINRTHVHITLPLHSLRDLCLREIKRRLRYDYQAFQLEIPSGLQRELCDMHPRKPTPNEQQL